jgi:hypothetical protein
MSIGIRGAAFEARKNASSSSRAAPSVRCGDHPLQQLEVARVELVRAVPLQTLGETADDHQGARRSCVADATRFPGPGWRQRAARCALELGGALLHQFLEVLPVAPQLLLRFTPLSPLSLLAERAVHGGGEARQALLEDVVGNAELEGVDGVLLAELSGEHDERHPRAELQREREAREAVEGGELVVGEDQIDRRHQAAPNSSRVSTRRSVHGTPSATRCSRASSESDGLSSRCRMRSGRVVLGSAASPASRPGSPLLRRSTPSPVAHMLKIRSATSLANGVRVN